ncbi:CbiX/SirB N-terminal domain-containing protein [Microbacterium horticulturae]|uniref:CbiX/SirB N-terminal domain-containing protein n=1 Tax=Microbacterium horticulturae TaxID=3028316 RepID=A0ABY8BWL8_9MICO|nr:CbiX/SirB N-terminal domain-containing protein [Microbacterium sp. KACC 23027]WEG08591.1 CbiX/SirB N-terminal domain-containing protein [Microbacterium sp. KACC 23027]
MPAPTLLAVSHGTDSTRGAAAIAELVARVAARLPDVDVRAAFVDVQEPDATAAASAIDGPLVIVPLLLSTGFHVRVDLQAAAAAHPSASVTSPLGPDARLAEVLATRIIDPRRPVILAAAGSRDPASAPACEQAAALLRERVAAPVHLAYLAARRPSLTEVAAQHPDALVVPYLLAHGFFHDLAARAAPDHDLAEPLLDGTGAPDAIIDLVVDRYASARG